MMPGGAPCGPGTTPSGSRPDRSAAVVARRGIAVVIQVSRRLPRAVGKAALVRGRWGRPGSAADDLCRDQEEGERSGHADDDPDDAMQRESAVAPGARSCEADKQRRYHPAQPDISAEDAPAVRKERPIELPREPGSQVSTTIAAARTIRRALPARSRAWRVLAGWVG